MMWFVETVLHVQENVTMFDAWSIVHVILPFISAYLCYHKWPHIAAYLLLIGYELVENLWLKYTWLMSGMLESSANIFGDLLLGFIAVYLGMKWAERQARRR